MTGERTILSSSFDFRASDEGDVADTCCHVKCPQCVMLVVPTCLTIAGVEDKTHASRGYQTDFRNCDSTEMASSMSSGDAYSSGL